MAWISFIVFQKKATFKIEWSFKWLLNSQLFLLFVEWAENIWKTHKKMFMNSD